MNRRVFATLLVVVPGLLQAQQAARSSSNQCPSCAEWNAPHRAFQVFGNTWHVGTRGLGAILVTSLEGHVLLDGGLPESAPLIAANIRALGFRVEDVKLIVNSHAHFDHAGGIAALQRSSGATVAAHPWSARFMELGKSIEGDPQFGLDIPYPPVSRVRRLEDGDTLRVGPLAVVAHYTGGHTPGSTSWSWRSCDDSGRCVNVVYGDSQTAVSADSFLYSRNSTYPNAVDDFRGGIARLEQLPCDLLLTPHPGASGMLQKLARRERGDADAFLDANSCKTYAATARQRLEQRLERERTGR